MVDFILLSLMRLNKFSWFVLIKVKFSRHVHEAVLHIGLWCVLSTS